MITDQMIKILYVRTATDENTVLFGLVGDQMPTQGFALKAVQRKPKDNY